MGLGSSLGDRAATLALAVRRLARAPGMKLVRVSRWYRSAPMRGGVARGWFLNGVAVFDTTLEPTEVLELCRGLEAAAGRRRARHWADRSLDLDVLVYEGVTWSGPALTLPHPGIDVRPFVWWPLREAWPALAGWLDARTPSPPPRFAISLYAPRRSLLPTSVRVCPASPGVSR